jgi:glycine oxidase
MAQQADVVILGAGVVGLSTARRLVLRGASTVVLDPATLGGQGSRAAVGVAIPSLRLHADPAMLAFVREARKSLDMDIERLSGTTSLRRGTGIMRLAVDERARESLESLVVNVEWLGHWLDKAEVEAIEPVLNGSTIAGAFLNEDGYVVDVHGYLTALLHETARLGADIRLGEGVLTVQEESGGVRIRTPLTELSAHHLIVAAGAWSGLIPGLPPLPIRPIRGQIMTLVHPAHSVSRVISGDRGGYLAPWRSGEIAVGATEEDAGFISHSTPAGLRYLTTVVARTAPALRDAQFVQSWAGLRAASPNGRLLLGTYPGTKRVFLATGHGGQGILTGALSGEIMAELVGTGKADLAGPFDPAENLRNNSRWQIA